MLTLTERLKAARRVAVPIVAIATPDPAATIRLVRESFEVGAKTPIPIVQYDGMNGLTGLNEVGDKELAKILKSEDRSEWPALTANPGAALAFMADLPGERRDVEKKMVQRATIVFMHNAPRYFQDEPGKPTVQILQGIWNLRDLYKGDRRTLVLLGPGFTLPAEIAQDVIVFDEPFPSDEDLKKIIVTQAESGKVKLTDASIESGIDALRGLAAFPAEQITAMSLDVAKGLDVDELWQRKIAVIEQTPGLSVDRGPETFADVRGLANFTEFANGLIMSKRSPTLYVRIDEIEKSFAGLGNAGGPGESTGTTKDRLGVMLKEMEDNGWTGFIAAGHAGTGKSLVTKALANTATEKTGRRVLSIALDLGATTGGILGESERKIRSVMKVIKSLAAGGRVCFVATCNGVAELPPALKRRFKLGTWMFDLPERNEKDAMWDLNLKKYSIKKQTRPDDAEWTGADIRNVCDVADNLECSLVKACQYVTLIGKSDPDAVTALRTLAEKSSFISASHPGAYKSPGSTKTNANPFSAPSAPAGTRAGRGEED